ncbi:MAG: GNAT family N-acetyltransferase [Rhodobacteraceae bacterium]|nr:GNAT family N-acetyltransferase [Paracoccaceae bacterium]
MENTRIIPAPASLRDEIKRLTAETHREHQLRQPYAFPENHLETFGYRAIDAAFLSLEGKPLEQSPVIFAAYVGEEFAGYIRLNASARPDLPPQPKVEITDIHVRPDFRQKGIGRALVEHVQKLSVERDWDNLAACVWSGNIASERLFQQARFVPECKVYRFGPERQARDWIVTAPKRPWIGRAFFWEALALVLLLAIALTLSLLR